MGGGWKGVIGGKSIGTIMEEELFETRGYLIRAFVSVPKPS